VSQENVKLFHEAVAAYERGGVEATLEYYDPNIEWITSSEAIDDYAYRGHEGVRKLWSLWIEQFDNFRLDAERVVDLADDRILVLGYQRGKIKGSDHELEQPLGVTIEVHEDKITRALVYMSWEEALKAVGLEE
jgi:ketosteroid isomerase-like protein